VKAKVSHRHVIFIFILRLGLKLLSPILMTTGRMSPSSRTILGSAVQIAGEMQDPNTASRRFLCSMSLEYSSQHADIDLCF
jgi:hypothetical protein